MSRRTPADLHPSLRAFPGVVLEISSDGTVTCSNGQLESLLGREVAEQPLEQVLDAVSAQRLKRVLEMRTRQLQVALSARSRFYAAMSHELLNIISHSLRLAGGSPVWVQCSADPVSVAIEVTDNGGGMSPEHPPDLFEEFTPLEGTATQPSGAGTGLGLPLARRLATLIGGRLEASTTRGVGNVFRLTLPITQDHPLPAGE